MAGESEVKAEVKLRFINTNGDRMVANRRLQVTKKKTALSLKTLEGTISFDDGSDDTKVSFRKYLDPQAWELSLNFSVVLSQPNALIWMTRSLDCSG